VPIGTYANFSTLETRKLRNHSFFKKRRLIGIMFVAKYSSCCVSVIEKNRRKAYKVQFVDLICINSALLLYLKQSPEM